MRSIGRESLHRRSRAAVATPNSALGAMGVRTREAWSTIVRADGPSSGSMMTRAIPTCASGSSCASVSRRSLSEPPEAEHQLQARGCGEAGLRCVPERRAPARRAQLEPHAEMREPKAQQQVRSRCPRSHDGLRERETEPGKGRPVDGPTDTSTASGAFVMPCFCHMAYRSLRLLCLRRSRAVVGDRPVLDPKEEYWPTISSSKDSRGEPSIRARGASAGHRQSRRRSSPARPASSARMSCAHCSTAGAGSSVWTCAASNRRDGSFSATTSTTYRSRSGPSQTRHDSTT